jgi:lipopolysaccharide exporter
MLTVKAARGAVWLVLSRLIGRLIDFFTLLVLARILTPADFGIAALAMTLVATIDTVLEVPVAQALIRLTHIDKSHLDTGFTIGLLRSSFLATIILAAAWPFSVLNADGHLGLLVSVMAIGPAARGLISPGIAHFMRHLGYSQTFILEVSGKFCAFIVTIIVVLNNGMYWAIVANYVTTSIVAVIVSYVVAPYRPVISLSRLPDFSGFVGWLSLAQIISALNWQGDRLLIGILAGKASLGRYAVANDLSVLATQSLIGPAMQPVMAAFSRINSEPARLRLAFMKAARLTMVISVPACIGTALTPDLLIELLLGPKWHEAAPLLQLLALSVALVPYAQSVYSLSLALDRTAIIFRLNVLDLCMRSLLLPAGFLLASMEGACIARILISTGMFFLNLVAVRQVLAIGMWQQLRGLWKIAVSAIVMAVGVLYLRFALKPADLPVLVEFVTVVAAGATLYGTALTLLGLRLRISATRLELLDCW